MSVTHVKVISDLKKEMPAIQGFIVQAISVLWDPRVYCILFRCTVCTVE